MHYRGLLFYKRFGYDPCKRYYHVLRIEIFFPFVTFSRIENITWDLNLLFRRLDMQLTLQKGLDEFHTKIGLK